MSIQIKRKLFNDYGLDPEEDISWESSIINSGTLKKSQLSPNNNISAVQNQMNQFKVLASTEAARQKALVSANSNRIRQSRYEGIQDRADQLRSRQHSVLVQQKKQNSMDGIEESRELERKKNSRATGAYKLLTTPNTPIPSSKSK